MRLFTRRTLRFTSVIAGAAAGALALSLAAVAPSSAEGIGAAEMLGTPKPYFIENVHAAGKILEIGNENAQKTGPDGAWTAAAGIFSLAGQPAPLAAQAVLAYPVNGATDTYVFASRDGEVLSRRANDDANFRYLDTSLTLDAAASSPYAQWKLVDAGNGAVYIHNVQRDANARTPALDMYNWATADGAEIQTYDAGTAAVQKWIMRTLDPTVTGYSARTEPGVSPVLPTKLAARYSWGRSVELTTIEWDRPDDTVWQKEGNVTVTGTAAGYFGEPVPVTANYLVGGLGEAVDTPLAGHVGITLKQLQMLAPSHVERTVGGSDTTVQARVSWDWTSVAADATARPGTFVVPATAETGFVARLVVTIAAVEQVNVLRQPGVTYDFEFKDGTAFALTDGRRDATGFADWRSGGAANRVNPNRVAFYFDAPRTITGAAVYDINGTKNVGQVTVQYRDIRGGWIDLPATGVTWPAANSTPDLSLTVESTPVLATGVRVIFSNKSSGTWMTLSEIEVFGPDSVRNG